MTTLGRDTAYLAAGVYMFIVGLGSGMFNSPNTAAMMGTVPPHRRGIAAGARVLVQNTGAVISIAFVLAVVTSSVPKRVLFAVFSGLANHITNAQLVPFIVEHAHGAVVPGRRSRCSAPRSPRRARLHLQAERGRGRRPPRPAPQRGDRGVSTTATSRSGSERSPS